MLETLAGIGLDLEAVLEVRVRIGLDMEAVLEILAG